MTSWQDVLQDTLTNQLLTFPPWQEMLWREAGVRPLFTWVGSGISSLLSCPTWLFFLSRITVPSSISNSPWSFKHLTCGVRWRHPVIIGGKTNMTVSPGAWEHPEPSRGVHWPQYRDSSGASCPAWCPGRHLHPRNAWSWPETFYTGWTIAAGTRTNRIITRNMLTSVCCSVWNIILKSLVFAI